MTDLISAAKTGLQAIEIQAATAIADFKTLAATRIGDALIAVIVLASIWIGHVL